LAMIVIVCYLGEGRGEVFFYEWSVVIKKKRMFYIV
jgi:hypothetical protein